MAAEVGRNTGVSAQAAGNARRSSSARRASALQSPPPQPGTAQADLLAWLASQLRLSASLARVERWGSSGVSPVVLVLDGGRRIRFADAAHLLDPVKLVQTVVLALGADAPQLPVFSRADTQDVFTVAVRASAAAAEDDEVERTRDWLDGLSRVVRELHHGEYNDPAARWAGLCWLAHEPNFDPRARHLAAVDARYDIPVVVWADGAHYVRVTDVERYIRGVLGQPLAVQQIGARLREAGCDHRRAEARRPGAPRTPDNRVRVSVFVLPREGERAVSPSSPERTRVRTPAYARSTGWGRLGTDGTTPTNTGVVEGGDTDQVGDTRHGSTT